MLNARGALVFLFLISVVIRGPPFFSASAAAALRLTAQNYEDLTRERAILIRFVTDWCEECEATKEDFEKLANDWTDHPVGLVAEVYCDSEDGTQICEEFEVSGYPSIYYGDPESPEIYKGKLDYDSMAAFAKDSISSLPCSVKNIEVCDEKVKATITTLREKGRDELESLEEQVLKKVEKEQQKFDKKATELQKKYEEIATAFNEEVDRLREESNFKWIQQLLNEMLEEEEGESSNKDEL